MSATKPTLEQLYSDPSTGLSRGSFLAAAKRAGYSNKESVAFYRAQSTTQVHVMPQRHFHGIVGPPHSWQIDLSFYESYSGLPANSGKRGILLAVEVTTRYMWGRAFRTKSPEELAPLLAELLAEHTVRTVTLDDGTEWRGAVAALFERNNVTVYKSAREGATARIERANRTLREKISRLFEATQSHAWVGSLQKLIESHNTTPSRTTLGYTPREALADSEKAALIRSADAAKATAGLAARAVLTDGTKVRTALSKNMLEKKTGPRFSSEIKTVERDGQHGLLLRVRGADGKLERRKYGAYELQVVHDSPAVPAVPVAAAAAFGRSLAARVDVPAVRREKRASELRAREGIVAENVVAGPRRTRGQLPARLRD